MIERASKSIILYPVSDRSAETLLPLISRHLKPSSTVYSDGLSANCDLNLLNFQHFTVIHTYVFKKT